MARSQDSHTGRMMVRGAVAPCQRCHHHTGGRRAGGRRGVCSAVLSMILGFIVPAQVASSQGDVVKCQEMLSGN